MTSPIVHINLGMYAYLEYPLDGDQPLTIKETVEHILADQVGLDPEGDRYKAALRRILGGFVDGGYSDAPPAPQARSAPAQGRSGQDEPRVVDLIRGAGPCDGAPCDKCGGPSYIDPRKSRNGNDMPHKCIQLDCMDKLDGGRSTYHMTHWPNECGLTEFTVDGDEIPAGSSAARTAAAPPPHEEAPF